MKRNDVAKVKTRQKMWERFGWVYGKSRNYLRKNHWLNCGCAYCRAQPFMKQYRNRQLRRKHKLEVHQTKRSISND